MAKPTHRRGITLNPKPDKIASVEQLTLQADASVIAAETRPEEEAEAAPDDEFSALLEQIRHTNAELGRGLQDQWGRQKTQLQELEQQREQIAEQADQLQALRQQQNTTARLGVLLSVLALSTISALTYHAWPRLQEMDQRLDQTIAMLEHPDPELVAARDKVDQLSLGAIRMEQSLVALSEQVVKVNSELGGLQNTVDALPRKQETVQVSKPAKHQQPTSSIQRVQYSTNRSYWNRRPMRSW